MSAKRRNLEALAEQVLKGQIGVSEAWQGADVFRIYRQFRQKSKDFHF